MTDPHPTSACPDCGAPLPPESPQSLCPACLMRQALASRTVARDGDKAPQLPPPSPEEIADRFPGYEILECLGRGGMGAVYKARQKSLNRLVAIKILAPERVGEGRFAERFTIEAELLAKLGHPHIVTIHDFGETGGLFYLVMEFIDGVNLRDLLRDGKLEPQQALAIVPPICDALQYAHDKGIVHRDIKPENILLDRDGRVKIADFGIASLVGASGENSGTPPYMAPEQNGGTVDRRADIYALGVVLYEMLTGERPTKELVAPSKRVEVSVKIDEMVLRALEKEPERRYQTAGEFRTMVETIASPSEIPVTGKESPVSFWIPALIAYVVTNALWLVWGVGAISEIMPFDLVVVLPGLVMSWLIACVLWAVLHYQCWNALPERHRATSPGKAVGLLFVPLFNFYWAFVSFPKLADGFNSARIEKGDRPDRMMTVLAVLYALNFLLYWTIAWDVRAGLFVCAVDLLLFIVLYRRLVREATALHEGLVSQHGHSKGRPADSRRSRPAVVGAVWAGLAFLGLICVLGGMIVGLPVGLARLMLIVVLSASSVGVTILGWVAVSQIRRSCGKIHGLGLAVFNGLLFPLLLLTGLIAWFWHWVFYDLIRATLIAGEPELSSLERIFANNSTAFTVLATLLTSLVVSFLIIRKVWRAASPSRHGRDDGDTTDNSKIGSYMAKDVLVMSHGKEILEDGDRKKRQAGAAKIAGSGDVRCRHDACRGIQANRRELALGS